jgi:hypothetical protein
MNFKGEGARAKVRMTLPNDNPRQTIYNEHFDNDELVFYIRERRLSGNRIGFWHSELLDGSKSINYTFSTQLQDKLYPLPEKEFLPKDPSTLYPAEFQIWLNPSTYIQSEDKNIKRYLGKIIGREKNVTKVVRKFYEFIRGEVKYRSERGSKDAKATLDKLVADCGGQARLFVSLSRAAGIPSRIVGGIVLTGGVKNITHVWAENFIGGQWVPFDVVNGHFAFIPNHYLELYRGDYVLIKHLGVTDFEYFFIIGPERLPPIDNPWSLYVLPVHFQAFIQVLLLIPIGALVIGFLRTVVGVPTFGTFAPILLSLAFREISLTVGLICVTLVISMGWVLRKALDYLKILVIPRLSIIVTMVVLFVLVLMIAGYHIGEQQILYISLFPMVIMTWMIERFSVLQIEDGTKAAFQYALGTVFAAGVAYYVMQMQTLRAYLFAFPELLLVIIALLLVLGRYTGIRISEIWRFRAFLKLRPRKE